MRVLCFFLVLLPQVLFSSYTEKFTLFVFQDAYHILPQKDGSGGLSQTLTLLEKERASTQHSFTLLNGPFLSPLYFSGWDRGEHIIDLLNQMNLDAVLLETHCLDYGIKELEKRILESKFQWLGNNLMHKDQLNFSKTVVIQAGKMQLGIISLVDMPLEESASIYCATPSTILRWQIRQLRKKKVDLILVLSNLGVKQDRKIAREFSDIDAIIGNGNENTLTWYEGRTLIHRISKQESGISRIDFVIKKTEEPHQSSISIYPSWRILKNQNIKEHTQLAKKIDTYHSQCLSSHSQEVGYLLYQISPQERYIALIKAFQRVLPIDGMILFSEKMDVGNSLLNQFFVIDLTGHELLQIIQSRKDMQYEFWDPKIRMSISEINLQKHYKIAVLGESDFLKQLHVEKVGLQQVDLARLIIELQQWNLGAKDSF